jgi:hypothetical protein
MSSSKRHFTAVVGSKEHGLYISSSPSSAARKIVSKLCVASKSKKVEFCVREITQSSKKKTYGPYLGEMKKLAKPIELKGRIIRYAPEVHLKKKKSAIKTVIKLDKKMKGGNVEKDGILTRRDFIFDIGNVDNFVSEQNIQHGFNQGTLYTIPKKLYNSIPEYILKVHEHYIKKNDKYIFFSKKLLDDSLINKNNQPYFKCKFAQYKYEYVLFLSNDRAIFKDSNMNEIDISRIPINALRKLKDYFEKRNKSNKSFDNIHKAVNDELRKNNRIVNYIELNSYNT